MHHSVVEALYPITFRKDDALRLGTLLRNRRSVVLIGMKRVGISNFLRFFLNHEGIKETYIGEKNHIFITVDLNDLVEREIYPFWILTFKRIADFIEEKIEDSEIKKRVSTLFLDSIQSQDLFLTIDGIRKSLVLLTEAGFLPTLFLLRFDRIADAATPEFFSNFQGIIEATHGKLSFVFTSVRPLETLSPKIFTKSDLSIFSDTEYVKPAERADVEILFDTTEKKYGITVSEEVKNEVLRLSDGYNQYLQFALITLKEHAQTVQSLEALLLSDERIILQSEELWESLSDTEKEILQEIVSGKQILPEEKIDGKYLFKTGLINNENKIFSVIFEQYVKEKAGIKKKGNHVLELSKKENVLLKFLEQKRNEVCEREEIIASVWPEAEALGVSDWAIDRLVARLRGKLKSQNSPDEIVTVKTRGYKLVKNSSQ